MCVWASRLSTSTLNAMGTNCGSSISLMVPANTEKTVLPGSVSSPERMRSSASRCSGVALSSMKTWQRPLPSWMAPGQAKVPTQHRPSSLTSL
ncbi:hypothetical protein D3C80_1858990 [compost metagenome]